MTKTKLLEIIDKKNKYLAQKDYEIHWLSERCIEFLKINAFLNGKLEGNRNNEE